MLQARMVWGNTSVICVAVIVYNGMAASAAIASPLNRIRFSTPDQNINCLYQEDERDVPSLRCQTRFVLTPLPPKPADCKQNWGGALRLADNGEVSVVCAGNPVAGDYATLDYGRVWQKGGLRCVARRSGLTCNSRNGKGFFLNREAWRRI